MAMVIIFMIAAVFVSLIVLGKKLSNQSTQNIPLEDIRLATEELKNVVSMRFEIVPAKIIYPKCIGFILQGFGMFMSLIFVAALLDCITFHGIHVLTPDYLGAFFAMLCIYLFLLVMFFVGGFSSYAWNYYYYKYGLSQKLQHADIIDQFISRYLRAFIKYHLIAVSLGYFIFRIWLGAGTLGAAIFSIITLVSMGIFVSIEEKRIGFAPIFNLFTEQLNELKGNKHG